MVSDAHGRTDVALIFTQAAIRYWLEIFPAARREIRDLRDRASRIPNPSLRLHAIGTLQRKWSNLEGAAAFAAFAPRRWRCPLARLLVDLQSIYDYADTLMEHPGERPSADACQLHAAFLAALEPADPLTDYYQHHPAGDDHGYLASTVAACRATIGLLPARELVKVPVRRNARRIVAYQCRINARPERGYAAFAEWASRETPAGADLRWWETGAACGSSTAVFALLAAAADPGLTRARVELVEGVYWPWAGALHTLLDSAIDRAEDEATSQPSLIAHYASPQEMAARMRLLATEALRRAAGLGVEHRLILAGMTSLYLTDAQAWQPDIRPTTDGLLAVLGELALPATLALRARRWASQDRFAGLSRRASLE